MKDKTELLFLAQNIDKLSEIVDYLIRREMCNGTDNLEYLSEITAFLCVEAKKMLAQATKMQE